MDELRIKSKFLKGIIENYICKFVKKKTGIDANLHINDVDVVNNNGEISFSVSINGFCSEKELTKLIKF